MAIKSLAKHSLFISTALVLVSSSLLPVGVFADTPSSPTCTPPSGQTGVHQPVGADAKTYTYNCTTGLWQNNYYTYDPATGITSPTYPVVYTYNTTTGKYDTTVWTYETPTNSYAPVTESVAQPPAGANVVGGPAPAVVPGGTSNAGNSAPDSNSSIDGGDGSGSGNINNTGPDSSNGINSDGTNDLNVNNQTDATFNNLIGQQAVTGDALVSGNTLGGSATSGQALNTATLANLLQSSSNALGSNAVTFVANINGDVNGDLLFDPASLSTIQNAGPSSTNTTNSSANNNLTVNNSTNAAINNNINLAANSGDATVTGNTTGGNATSGNADNIVNVINMIDSMLTAGQSFIGTININGNLNGNIEVPADFVNQLLADNVPTVTLTGPNSNNTTTSNANNQLTATNTNNEGITNNVTSSATSGNATVSNNTSGGSATSGNAGNSDQTTNTSITAFNLTGSQVIGTNDLLVFVNVTGQWVGLILNTPAGTTAAEFGGGISTTGPNSTNSNDSSTNNNATINNNANEQINNNINTMAQSGNASVTDNTTGGNATSGDADNLINIANTENSTFNLTGWFGILFINVLGSWHGNFGIEPSPADSVGGSGNVSSATTGGGSNTGTAGTIRVFRFMPTNKNSSTGSNNSSSNSGNNVQTTGGTVLAAHISKNGTTPTPQLTSAHRNLLLPLISIVLFLVYLVGDRMHTIRQARAKAERN